MRHWPNANPRDEPRGGLPIAAWKAYCLGAKVKHNSSIANLVAETRRFFELHWPESLGAVPEWEFGYEFLGTMPNNNRPGCYAIIADSEVIYVGSGVSKKGKGIYRTHGLGTRINDHVLSWDRSAKPRGGARQYKFKDRWAGSTKLATIGFEPDQFYLSIALEVFLIRNLEPTENALHRT